MCEFLCATVLRFRHAGVSYRRGARATSPGPHRFKPGTSSGFSFRNMRRLTSRLSAMPARVKTIDPRFAGNTRQRITGSQLQRIRREHFARYPLCVECDKRGDVRAATELDHIVALCNGGIESRDPFVNRQGLCEEHHREKTERDLAESAARLTGQGGGGASGFGRDRAGIGRAPHAETKSPLGRFKWPA